MIPHWFTSLSIAMLALGVFCALIIAVDLWRGHKQHMWIMNVVWPVTALFGTALSLWVYFRYGRLAEESKVRAAQGQGQTPPNRSLKPFPVMVASGTAHCGSGCALGDICAEVLALNFPVVAVWLGWQWLFPAGEEGRVLATWVLDYALAFAFGILFQYFTIKPMRELTPAQGLAQAVKADALSLTAWQVGMYGAMAVAQFWIFAHVWSEPIEPDMPEFWFVMQIAMLFGFATSYPVNWWLIRSGIKEAM